MTNHFKNVLKNSELILKIDFYRGVINQFGDRLHQILEFMMKKGSLAKESVARWIRVCIVANKDK